MNTALTGPPDYDAVAEFYQRHWCNHYHKGLLAMLERTMLSRLQPGAHILDVCCGAGTVAKCLVGEGFRVTGVDASAKLLGYAREEVPEAEFLLADARAFQVPADFDGALCTFDSLSYMLNPGDLEFVLRNVHAALRPGGLFVFDLSLEDAYRNEWHRSCSIVEENEACFVRGHYDEAKRLGQTQITAFYRKSSWERTDVTFTARCHRPDEVLRALINAGFTSSVCRRSDEDENLRADLGPGRACFVAVKS